MKPTLAILAFALAACAPEVEEAPAELPGPHLPLGENCMQKEGDIYRPCTEAEEAGMEAEAAVRRGD